MAPAPEEPLQGQPEVAILDAAVLVELGAGPLAIDRILASAAAGSGAPEGARSGAPEGAPTTAALAAASPLRPVLSALRADVEEAARRNPPARVTSIDGFRLFDVAWLASPETGFEPIGVFHRLDRRPFEPGTCGEVRFLYRLAYRTTQGGEPMRGRLPLTLNVVFHVPEGDCAAEARAWIAPRGLDAAGRARWLVAEGALSPSRRARFRLKSVEANLQSLRLQSTVQTTLAGHIEYVLRVFRPDAAGELAPAPLENQLDVARLRRDPALRAELLAHLRRTDVLEDVDRGTLRLPDRFLATRAISVAPQGLARLGNRPFRALLTDADLADLPLAGRATIGSPKALLRRLDGASCTGCHQSRSIAGFHHVGDDLDGAPAFTSLRSGSSAHLEAELVRRSAYVAAVARGEAPDERRPQPERQGAGRGHGAPCGLGDRGFADWTCAEGLRCVATEDPEIGTCLGAPAVGDPCEWGPLRPGDTPRRDHVALSRHACGEGMSCQVNLQGFAQGACTTSCRAAAPGGVCAPFLDVDGYQECLRRGGTERSCAEDHVLGAGMRACSIEAPCRQDFVCARTTRPGVGACVPPYFVFPLRLDGYPLRR